MNGNAVRFLRFACALFGVVVAGWFLVVHAAQPAGEGFPTDWTHSHAIFSQPANPEQAQRIAQDTRYWQQWYRQRVARTLDTTDEEESSNPFEFRRLSRKTKGFWSENMGTGATVGAGNFPAKYSFGVTKASCSDYVVFNTGLAGVSGSQASVIAYNNLYSGCTGSPSVYWAYNTNGGQVLTSPAISLDGTQVAFVQTSGGVGSLVLLKFAASGGSASAPVTLAPVTSLSLYRSCTAPCMASLPLDISLSPLTTVNDTTSSVFPDYRGDAIYVGGASGWLFKFSGVFLGTPAEVMTGGFPVQVNATAGDVLTSPVYDSQSDNVYVADSAGYLYQVSPTGTVTASAQLDHGRGFVAGPIVDLAAGYVYIFSSRDTAGTNAAVYAFRTSDFPTTVSDGTVGTPTAAGSAVGNPLYEPGFDSTYWNSSDATGNLYVCGRTGGAPILYRLPITAGTFGTATAIATLTPGVDHEACSPVTDIYNPNASTGPVETVFFSVINDAHPTPCANGGCAMSFVDLQWQPTTSYNVGQQVLVLSGATLYTEVATAAGKSGATAPTWPTTAGGTVVDGTVTWTGQGATTVTPTAWAANHNYNTLDTRVSGTLAEANGTSVYYQIVTKTGRSGATQPTWNTAVNGTTTDGTVIWTNIGSPYSALATTGGTSGIIIDNIVGSGTLAGTSQVYFSTIGNQSCTTSGTIGGCAIQASQSALQ
jgi:hypothetical protein